MPGPKAATANRSLRSRPRRRVTVGRGPGDRTARPRWSRRVGALEEILATWCKLQTFWPGEPDRLGQYRPGTLAASCSSEEIRAPRAAFEMAKLAECSSQHSMVRDPASAECYWSTWLWRIVAEFFEHFSEEFRDLQPILCRLGNRLLVHRGLLLGERLLLSCGYVPPPNREFSGSGGWKYCRASSHLPLARRKSAIWSLRQRRIRIGTPGLSSK